MKLGPTEPPGDTPTRRYAHTFLRTHRLTDLARAFTVGVLMPKAGMFLTFLSGVIFTAPFALAQAESDSATRFTQNAMKLRQSILFKIEPGNSKPESKTPADGRYPWHQNIVTTIFWIGESPTGNNPVPNRSSAWDLNWSSSYGGSDSPDAGERRGFLPAKFVPRQNPFYIALPYNDVSMGRTKPEAYRVIPWFNLTFARSGQSVLKDRWVAIRKLGRICYAQWEDVGPFSTDNWQYVFGTDRPRPNLNRGAGLDVSPAVRDYLNLAPTDATDWKFADFSEVPPGPWALYGDNNTFVIDRQKREDALARLQQSR